MFLHITGMTIPKISHFFYEEKEGERKACFSLRVGFLIMHVQFSQIDFAKFRKMDENE